MTFSATKTNAQHTTNLAMPVLIKVLVAEVAEAVRASVTSLATYLVTFLAQPDRVAGGRTEGLTYNTI